MNTKVDYGKAFEALNLMGRISTELYGKNDITSFAIKQGLSCKDAEGRRLLFKTIVEQLNDGWQGLSTQLSNDIKLFYLTNKI